MMLTGPMVSPAPVEVSEELFAPIAGDMELCYQTFGDPADEPLLLVMGLGGPMTWWDPDLCSRLARAGYYVIRYDNRDVGRSSAAAGRVGSATVVRAFTGGRVRAPYSMNELAQDAFGLLDHLGIDAAHVWGISMGGMIAQTMAINAPQRVLSLVSMMSTTGRRSVGWQHPSLIQNLLLRRGPAREEFVAGSIQIWRRIGSPGYPVPEEELRARAENTFDRGVNQEGVRRQMLAVVSQPNRTDKLHGLRMPTLVIHGLADRMVHVSGGRATAAAIPGAELLLIGEMGHDVPRDLFDTFVSAFHRNAVRAASARDRRTIGN